MNPILSREIRSRFRDKRSFWLLFGVCALLGIAAWWVYSVAAQRLQYQTMYSPIPNQPYAIGPNGMPYGYPGQYTPPSIQEHASKTGRELFTTLAFGNVIIWLLIAPALTATGLCSERERGLLESLWLSPFKVSSQIFGRLMASLLFLAELQLVTLPIYGIAVLLGGVSPQEVLTVGSIVGMTALGGASLGLWCSARAYRPVSALANAVGIVVLASVIFSFGFYLARETFITAGWAHAVLTLNIVQLFHPYALLDSLIGPGSGTYFVGMLEPSDIFPAILASQFALSLLLLFGATRLASKPRPEAAWLGKNPFFERWRRGLEERKKQRLEREEKARVSEKVGGALLYEVPFEKLVRFRDPLLSREVRARFRMRQSGFVIALLRFVALFVIALAWLLMISTIFDPPLRGAIGPVMTFGIWGFGVAVVGVLASTAFTREYESGTWEGLQLSLLTVREIVVSKWISPLVTFGFWSAPLWVWLPFCVQYGRFQGVPIVPMLGIITLAIASLGVVAAWGLYLSTRTPNSAAATSWTLATLLIVIVGIPMLVEVLNIRPLIVATFFPASDPLYDYGYPYGPRYGDYDAMFDAYNPINALRMLLDSTAEPTMRYGYNIYHPGSETKLAVWLIHMGFCGALTTLLLTRTMKRAKKRET